MPPAATTPGIVRRRRASSSCNGSASSCVVPGAGEVHFECEDTVGPEPEVHSLQAIVARQQHAGANQQCQRERKLNGRQHIAKLSLCPRTSGARLLTKRPDGRDATKTHRGRDATRDCRRHRDERAKSEHDRIESNFLQPRNGTLAKDSQYSNCDRSQQRVPPDRQGWREPGFQRESDARAGDDQSRGRDEQRTR